MRTDTSGDIIKVGRRYQSNYGNFHDCFQSEDEWNDMAQRFKKEGIDYNNLKVEHKLLYVWRWLVDSEINLKNSRRMLDKLHEQQHEEIEVRRN